MSIFNKKQPEGDPSKTPVTFTLQDAKRVVSAVRVVEGGKRPGNPSTLPRAAGGGGGGVATAKFTAAWSKGANQTITFLVNTSETAIATNLFSNIAAPSGGFRKCAVAKEGTTWILIAAECQ